MNYIHQVILLPEHHEHLCSDLNLLSRDGWEFVSWLPNHTTIEQPGGDAATAGILTDPPSRRALMRRADPT